MHFPYLIGFDEEICRCGLVSKLSGDGGKEGLGSIRKRKWGMGAEKMTSNDVLISKEEITRMLQRLFPSF